MITTFNEINDTTPEGQTLMAALAVITSQYQSNKTPDEILLSLQETGKLMGYTALGMAQRAVVRVPDDERGNISDGYHTFNELYEHRIVLYIALCSEINSNPAHQYTQVWKTTVHSDGSVWDGWFIMGINLPDKRQITYHLPLSKWNECEFAPTFDKAPEFDGHTSEDVLERLKSLFIF
jgi:hypothetical protein